MKNKISWFAILAMLVACEPDTPFDEAAEREKILALHHAQRDYHFNAKAEDFVNQMSEDFISVNQGVISHPAKAESLERFGNYFNLVTFSKWDDTAEPVIRFAGDGSLAYTIVAKEVVLTYPDEEGNTIEDRTEFAWTAIYRKQENGEWKIESVTSTNKPSENRLLVKE